MQQWELEPTDPKAAAFWAGVGGAARKPANPVLAGKLEEQGSRAVSAAPCYRVLTGTRARIWVKENHNHTAGVVIPHIFISRTWH